MSNNKTNNEIDEDTKLVIRLLWDFLHFLAESGALLTENEQEAKKLLIDYIKEMPNRDLDKYDPSL